MSTPCRLQLMLKTRQCSVLFLMISSNTGDDTSDDDSCDDMTRGAVLNDRDAELLIDCISSAGKTFHS